MNRGAEIIKLIEENPGIKFREIMRETQMKNGVLSYHVKRLEESGSVKIERKSGQTRFYPLFVTEEESILIKNLRQETPRRIMLTLLNDEMLSFSDIVEKVHKSASTVSTYLSQLIKDKIVETKSIKLKKVFYIKKIDMAKEIIQKYNPILLERTAYNLADTFSSL
ncbi:MAG: winged helix-turn-helix transcriptional regulator [Thaumarchaeota archaeon]|nr:MAG: winged helix-turn-helix transcriptional regulator [Nitrososphaerota archaeon]TLX94667.1 MAG: winged helix-turn-helix transcriptional regulator [Nitrososphaerota archaeon]